MPSILFSLMHGGSSEYKLAADKAHWSSALENNSVKQSIALGNAKRTGTDLKIWVDSLSKR